MPMCPVHAILSCGTSDSCLKYLIFKTVVGCDLPCFCCVYKVFCSLETYNYEKQRQYFHASILQHVNVKLACLWIELGYNILLFVYEFYFILCVCVASMHTHLCTTVSSLSAESRNGSYSGSCSVGSGNPVWVLWESKACS